MTGKILKYKGIHFGYLLLQRNHIKIQELKYIYISHFFRLTKLNYVVLSGITQVAVVRYCRNLKGFRNGFWRGSTQMEAVNVPYSGNSYDVFYQKPICHSMGFFFFLIKWHWILKGSVTSKYCKGHIATTSLRMSPDTCAWPPLNILLHGAIRNSPDFRWSGINPISLGKGTKNLCPFKLFHKSNIV